MARFLSAAWFEEVDRALGSAAGAPDANGTPDGDGASGDVRPELTVQQVVTDSPDGEVRYFLEIGSGGVVLRRGQAGRADATFTEDYATAAAIAGGELSPQDALLAGRIRVAGNLSALLEHRNALAALDALPAELRKATTF